MSRLTLALAAATALGSLAAGIVLAGPEKVKYPEGYRGNFVLYNTVDRPDRKAIRFLYINKDADTKAKPGQQLPDGAVLILEERKAKLDEKGQPVLDADGRMQATDEITGILAMERQKGWGAEYPSGKRNGEWEYQAFKADGTPITAMTMDACFACHLNRADRDYTFTYWKNRADRGN